MTGVMSSRGTGARGQLTAGNGRGRVLTNERDLAGWNWKKRVLSIFRDETFCGFVGGTLSWLIKVSLYLRSCCFYIAPLSYGPECLGMCWVTLAEIILYSVLLHILQLCIQPT